MCGPRSCAVAHLAPLPSASCFLLPRLPSGMSMASSPRGSSRTPWQSVLGSELCRFPFYPPTPAKPIARCLMASFHLFFKTQPLS